MKSCEEIRALLEAAADHAASPEQLREIDEHMKTCEECREYARFLETLDDALHFDAEPPEGFTDRVMRAVREQSVPAAQKKKKLILYLRFGAMAASLVLIVALAIVLGGRERKAADMAPSAGTNMAMDSARTESSKAAMEEIVNSEQFVAMMPAETTAEAEPAYSGEEDTCAPESTAAGSAYNGGDETPPQGYARVYLIDGDRFPDVLSDLPVVEENGVVYVVLTPELEEAIVQMGYPWIEQNGEGAVAMLV